MSRGSSDNGNGEFWSQDADSAYGFDGAFDADGAYDAQDAWTSQDVWTSHADAARDTAAARSADAAGTPDAAADPQATSAFLPAVSPQQFAQRDSRRQRGTARTAARGTAPAAASGTNSAAAATPAAAGAQQPQAGSHAAATANATTHAGAPDLSRSEQLIRVRKKRKRHKVRNAVLITLAVIVVLVGAGVGAAALYINSLNQTMSLDDEELNSLKEVLYADNTVDADDATEEDDAFYILVLGSDAREEDEASRSDVIILVRVDPAEGQITLVSIPRDTMVELDDYGTSKINAAYAYGGAAGAVTAVQDFAGVKISHYVEIHFEELEELVDMLGGVWVDVPVSNTQTGSSNTGVEILEGEQLMDGETALAFARERYGYLEGDFQRTENQRILATAIIKAVLETSAIDLPSTISQLASCVGTDYSVTDIVTLAQQFQSADDLTIYSAMVPSSTSTINGVSYAITDYTSWNAMMELVDAGEDPNDYEEALASEDDATDDDSASDADAADDE